MSHNLPTLSLRVADLFARPYLFAIPPFQRSYSWTVKEAGQLMDDVTSAAGLDATQERLPDYFLGAMVLMDPGHRSGTGNGSAELREVDIVDGQQRTITLALMLAALRDLEEADGDLRRRLDRLLVEPPSGEQPARCRIALHNVQSSEIARILLGDDGPHARPEAGATEGGASSIAVVQSHIMKALAALDAVERRELAEYIVERCHVVAVVSHEIDHAHRLFVVLNERGKPLQRSDILKAEVLSGVPHGQIEWAVSLWDGIVRDLGQDMEHLLSHLRTMHGHVKPQIIAGVRTVMAASGGSMNFLQHELAPTARAYRLIEDVAAGRATITPEADRALACLSRLSGSEWMPAALATFRVHEGDTDAITARLRHIDRLALALRILGVGTGKRVHRFAGLVADVWSGRWEAPRGAPHVLSRDDARRIFHNLKDLHVRAPQVSKLLLWRLSDEMEGRLTFVKAGETTVEHILPQRPQATSDWLVLFPEARERERWTESLGNLVLVGPAENDRARNSDYADKKRLFAAAASLPAITREALLEEHWDRATIRQREERLLDMVRAMLDIDRPGAHRQSGAIPLPQAPT